jgi:non-ribosomal peptide synthetase component E (peptide arylation enzyme)
LGERIATFIIPKDGGRILSLTDITAFLETKGISKSHWPEAIKIVEHYPMTSSGKVQRFILRTMAKDLHFSN